MDPIGVLGEDETDCCTIAELIRRIVDAIGQKRVSIERRYPPTGGCAMMRRKAASYTKSLIRSGCTAVVVVHDLDRNPANGELNDEVALRKRLGRELAAIVQDVQMCICIPIEEIEAWFWSDQLVLDEVGKGYGKAHISPHNVVKPKEALMRLSMKAHRKVIYSTNDNPRLAQKLRLDVCAERCESFRMLREFIVKHATSMS